MLILCNTEDKKLYGNLARSTYKIFLSFVLTKHVQTKSLLSNTSTCIYFTLPNNKHKDEYGLYIIAMLSNRVK